MRARALLGLLGLLNLAACGDSGGSTTGSSSTSVSKPSGTPKPSASTIAGPSAVGSANAPPSGGRPDGPIPPIAADAKPITLNDKLPKWFEGMPDVPVTAKKGDRVWTGPPYGTSKGTSFSVWEVDSVTGNEAAVAGLDRRGDTLVNGGSAKEHTPGFLIYPAQDASTAKAGDLAVASVFGYGTHVVHVESVDGKRAKIKYANDGKVKDELADYVAPLYGNVAPLSWVAAKVDGKWRSGWVMGVWGDKVWVDGYDVYVVPKSDVKPLAVDLKDRKVGDKVVIVKFGDKEEGTIESVVEPKYVFKVKLAAKTETVEFEYIVDSF